MLSTTILALFNSFIVEAGDSLNHRQNVEKSRRMSIGKSDLRRGKSVIINPLAQDRTSPHYHKPVNPCMLFAINHAIGPKVRAAEIYI
jgi:hypothetical protein